MAALCSASSKTKALAVVVEASGCDGAYDSVVAHMCVCVSVCVCCFLFCFVLFCLFVCLFIWLVVCLFVCLFGGVGGSSAVIPPAKVHSGIDETKSWCSPSVVPVLGFRDSGALDLGSGF